MNNRPFGMGFFEYGIGSITSLLTLLPLFFLTFGVIYVLNLVHGWRVQRREPMLGGQVFLGLMLTVAFQIVLVGLTLLLWRFLEGDGIDQAIKAGGGPLLGGCISGLFPAVVYAARVHARSSGRVLRQGLGVNAVFTGLVFAFSVTALMTMWVNKANRTTLPLVMTAVYLLANVLCSAPLLNERSSLAVREFHPDDETDR